MDDVLLRMNADDDATADVVAELTRTAFGFPRDTTRRWVDLVGRENWRFLGSLEDPEALMGMVPMAQFIGGRSVQMTGIAGVAVPAQRRGRGAARRMMAAAVREMHASRVGLSVLYSALHPLYRGAGYETSGTVHEATVPAALFPAGRFPEGAKSAGWRPFVETRDMEALRSCYGAYARHRHGFVDRGGYMWDRVQRPRLLQTDGFVCTDEAGAVEAYVFYRLTGLQNESEGTGTSVGMDMVVTDMAWSSRAGLDHLSTFLRGFGSIVGNVVFSTPVESAMLLRLPDRRFQVAVADRFMCRITHLETAISSRGFRRDTAAEIGVVLTDPVITDHSGAWTIRVDAEGQGACVRGGAGGLELEARWLGPLYLGHVSARELRDAGLVTASDAICDAWDRVFGGFGPPAMVDMF